MDKTKVGIITLPGNFNYGNRLQCYAMTEVVRKVGCVPTVLEREQPFSWHVRTYHCLKKVLLGIAKTGGAANPESLRSPRRAAAFGRFSANIPIETLSGDGRGAAVNYDYIVVGSDQVWNPNECRHQESWYFAKFARPEQRIAVAASIGVDVFASAVQASRIADGVKGFSRVSVREERGAQMLRECAGINPEVICDPTLVLTSEEWRSVADSRLTPSETYVFTYLLGGVGSEARDVLSKATDGGRIPVISLSDRQKPGEPDAGPAEFIDLISHAKHVVTDSFHAAVFSSIFQTPLTIVHREGKTNMFSRLEQLSQALGIEEKVYGTSSYDLALAESYEGVSDSIEQERRRFMSYLEECLNG